MSNGSSCARTRQRGGYSSGLMGGLAPGRGEREKAFAHQENEHREKECPPYLSLQPPGAGSAFFEEKCAQRSEEMARLGGSKAVLVILVHRAIDGGQADAIPVNSSLGADVARNRTWKADPAGGVVDERGVAGIEE